MPYSKIITRGIHYLATLQHKDGSFSSYSSSSPDNFLNALIYESTFLNAIILTLLCDFPESEKINKIKVKLANFLLSEKSEHWSWNYWTNNSLERKNNPYPDDLDDTFCALTALTKFDKKLISPEVFGKIVSILTATEKKVGGPYKTWLVGKKSSKVWRDVDIAVNTNIAYFLSLHDIVLPNLEKFFLNCFKDKTLQSRYYPSSLSTLYFLSRFYRMRDKERLLSLLNSQRKQDGQWKNPLDAAIGIITFLNFSIENVNVDKDIAFLLDTYGKEGWAAFAFCLDPAKNGKKYFAGSSALTTVFCLLALQKYSDKENQLNRAEATENGKLIYCKKIFSQVEAIYQTKNVVFEKQGISFMKMLAARDTRNDIPLFPYYFYSSLKDKYKILNEKIIIKLGAINIFGWIAYTIYDDFLDEEGEPELLSLGLLSLRLATDLVISLKDEKIFGLFSLLLDKVDYANAWEALHCRDKKKSPNKYQFRLLAEKSIGHAFGPLCILLLLGFDQKNKTFQSTYSFYENFIIAKQLNDDAHDVIEDYQHGHITPVVSLLLKKMGNKKYTVNMIKKLFWKEVIDEVCKLIYAHVDKAKSALQSLSILEDKTILTDMLIVYENAATKALQERSNVKVFLKAYKKT